MISGVMLSTLYMLENRYEYISTGSKNLDTILGGGIRTSAITEIFGDTGCGTQFSIELMINATLGVDGNVIYVSTKKCLSPKVIKEKINRHLINVSSDSTASSSTETSDDDDKVRDTLKKISYMRVLSLDHLIFAVYHCREMVEKLVDHHNSIKLIIIDSLTYFLRNQTPLERVRISYELAGVLEDTAIKFNCAIIVTTDMSANLEAKGRHKLQKPLLKIFTHRSNQRIEFQKTNSNSLTAFVWKNINGKGGIVEYEIDDEEKEEEDD